MQEYILHTLYINPTRYCNLRCSHCWLEPPYQKSYPKAGDELSVGKLIGIIKAAIPLGLRSVKFTGGEPLLRDDLIELLAFCKEKKLEVIIETNGTLIDEKKARVLKEMDVSFISVSLDGVNAGINDAFRRTKGAFDLAVAGIRNLINVGFSPQIITCLHRQNALNFGQFIDLLNNLKIVDLKINIINYIGRAKREDSKKQFLSVREILEFSNTMPQIRDRFPYRILLDIPPAFQSLEELDRDGTCGIFSILGVLSGGEISICGIGTHIKELIFGSFKEDNDEEMQEKLRNIWLNHPKLQELRRDVPQNLQGVCGRCILKWRCLGKCRANSYYYYGHFLAPDDFCQTAFEEGLFPITRLIPSELIGQER